MAQSGELINPSGMMLPLRLYKINGGPLGSAESIEYRLKNYPVEFKNRRYYEGFSDVELDNGIIRFQFTTGQEISVQTMRDMRFRQENVYSQGKCEYLFHLDKKFLECRGTSWVAKKGITLLQDLLGIEFEKARLSENAMSRLCRDAKLVKSVQISNIDDPNLEQIQINGDVLGTSQWSEYRPKGIIQYFRGHIKVPENGRKLSVQVTNKGTMLIYKTRDGIAEQDVIYAVNMIMNLSEN